MVNNRAKIRRTQTICVKQDDESTESGSLIGSNDDLLTQILLWLPAISICRFKSVSKHWRSLLSDRRFILLYDKVSISFGLFVHNLYIPYDDGNQNATPFRSLDFYHDRCRVKIMQSCNGLLLCCNYRGKKHERKYYVCNPTTMQVAVIPSIIGGPDACKTIHFMGLAFHKSDCVHYKIVCIRKAKPKGDLFQIQIYSSDTGKWRISHESVSGSFMPSMNGAYWNGAVHWSSGFYVLYFKLDVEQLQKLFLPGMVASPRGYYYVARLLYFGESGGRLHLVESPSHQTDLHLNVYEMLNDHSGWFIKYKVELDELSAAYPEMIRVDQRPWGPCNFYEFEVYDVVRGEEEEDTFMVVKILGKIIRYNILDKSFKQIFSLPNLFPFQTNAHADVHRYIGTLFSF